MCVDHIAIFVHALTLTTPIVTIDFLFQILKCAFFAMLMTAVECDQTLFRYIHLLTLLALIFYRLFSFFGHRLRFETQLDLKLFHLVKPFLEFILAELVVTGDNNHLIKS